MCICNLITIVGANALLRGGLLGLAVLALPAVSRAGDPLPIREALDSFPAGNKTIRVERFEPKADGKHPAIVLLHGVDGAEGKQGDCYRLQAAAFAKKGYVVLLVHYFDRNDLPAKEWAAQQECFRHYFNPAHPLKPQDAQVLAKQFDAWADTVAEAVRHAGGRPNVDPQRIGLAGLSLGGALALRAAAQDRAKVAIVGLFGGLPEPLRAQLRGLPPTLLIHGDLDERVPPREGYALERALIRQKVPLEFQMYQRVGHAFEGADLRNYLNALQQVENFLRKHLLDAPAARTGR